MTNSPLVSVIIPCYNAERFAEPAVRSIMDQTYKNLEILVADDCSTDGTFRILQKLEAEDTRIKLFRNEENLKIVQTLNRLVIAASGKYIARMDADDISLPERIERQVSFLENKPDFSFCGTNAVFINEKGRFIGVSHVPASEGDIKTGIKYQCAFLHPSVVIKAEVLKEYKYREGFLFAEDYDLWIRLLKNNFHGVNLKKRLLKYRILKASVSHSEKSRDIQKNLAVSLSEKINDDVYKISDKKFLANILVRQRKIYGIKIPFKFLFSYYTERLLCEVLKWL